MEPPTLQVNDLIQVRVVGGEVRDSYPSRIEDLRGDDVVIAWPTVKGELLPVTIEQTLSISFAHDGRYFGFEGIVREATAEPIPVLVLHAPVKPDRIERRDNVRVRVPVPIELTEKVVSLSDYRASGEHRVIRTLTADISGGGFGIQNESYIAVGTAFDVRLTLPDKMDPISMAAKVVRCNEVAEGSLYQVGFAYTQIPEKLRSRIVRFVFAVQLSEMHPPD